MFLGYKCLSFLKKIFSELSIASLFNLKTQTNDERKHSETAEFSTSSIGVRYLTESKSQ